MDAMAPMASPLIIPSDQDWENHRGVLEDLYETHTMQYVMQHMRNHYKWSAKRNQYEKWLVCKWKISKNVSSSLWKAIYPHVRALELARKPFEVWINGSQKSSSKIHKELQRVVRECPKLVWATPQALPKGVFVRETSSPQMNAANVQLPFHAFDAHFGSYAALHRHPTLQARAGPGSVEAAQGSAGLILGGSADQQSWLAIPAYLANDRTTYPMPPSTIPRLINGTFQQNVIFSISNNFAGLTAHVPERTLRLLQHITSETLFERLRSASHYYTAQAIIFNLFKVAIEMGDSMMIGILLDASLLRVGVNQIVCGNGVVGSTAIERAALLGHRDVVKVLLGHDANVNLSFGSVGSPFPSPRGGALEMFAWYLLEKLESTNTITCYPTREMAMDWELFGILVQADGQISPNTIIRLAKYDSQGHLLRLLLSKRAHRFHGQWCQAGVFSAFFRIQDNAVMTRLVDIMIEVGADLNHDSYNILRPPEDPWHYRLIDAVARGGNINLMQRLLRADALLTKYTLSYAIDSGNENLVRLLVDHGANVTGEPLCYICPLAAAVRQQHKSMVDLVAGHMNEEDLCISHVFISTWRVAVEIGSIEWIRELLTLCAKIQPSVLGQALSIAAAYGMREVALELIEAGADPNCPPDYFLSDYVSPLLSALKQQDYALVHALLDADAEKTYWSDDGYLDLAVLWGDLDIISHLLSKEGSLVNSSSPGGRALNNAIKRCDYKMMDLLIEAWQHNDYRGHDNVTALTAAVQTGEVQIVRYILERGADPFDSRALLKALDQSPEVLELLMKEFAKRYPNGRPGWGAQALKAAIHSDNFPLFERLLTSGADPLSAPGRSGPVWYEDDLTTAFGYAISQGGSSGIRFVEHLLQGNGRAACTPETIVEEDFKRPRANCIPGMGYVETGTFLTAMLTAIDTKSQTTVDLMLRYGADVDHPAAHGIRRTPLQMAVEVNSMELVKHLLEKGADVNGAPAKRGGATALQLAAINGHTLIARLLIERGAKVDLPPLPYNLSALEGAAYNGRLDMVALVLSAWASVTNADRGLVQRQVASATTLANERGYYYIANMLKQYMDTGEVAAFEPDIAEADALKLFDFERYALEAGA